MRFQLTVLVLTLIQFAFSFEIGAFKKQYQAAIGDPCQDAVTVLATNIIEYLAASPVPTTPDATNQMVTNLISQAQSFTASLNTAAASSDALNLQLNKESQVTDVENQMAVTEQQLQQTNAQIQQTTAQVTDTQNQVNAASKSVQDASNSLRDQQIICTMGGGGELFGKMCQRAQQNLASCQQRLTSLQAQLTQYQVHLTQLNQQQNNLQKMKAELESKKMQQQTMLNQARDNLGNVNTNLRKIVAHVALLKQSQSLVDVVKTLIDAENVITPLTNIVDQVTSYTSTYSVNYLKILKQKINTNLPLVQQKLPQFASA